MSKYLPILFLISFVINRYFPDYHGLVITLAILFICVMNFQYRRRRITYAYAHETESYSEERKVGYSSVYRHPDCKEGLLCSLKLRLNTL